MRARVLMLVLVALLLLAACGGASDESGDETAGGADTEVTEAEPVESEAAETGAEGADATSEAAGDGGAVIEVADTDLGEILVDGEGVSLYLFDNDTDGTSVCTGDCADTWPPLTGDVTAGEGVDAALLGTTERDDGTLQTTYDDQPLYYFAGDTAAGELNGQGVGEIWWVVGPDGQKITDQVGQAETSAAGGY